MRKPHVYISANAFARGLERPRHAGLETRYGRLGSLRYKGLPWFCRRNIRAKALGTRQVFSISLSASSPGLWSWGTRRASVVADVCGHFARGRRKITRTGFVRSMFSARARKTTRGARVLPGQLGVRAQPATTGVAGSASARAFCSICAAVGSTGRRFSRRPLTSSNKGPV